MKRSETKIRLLAVYHILNKRGRASMAQILQDLDLQYDIQCDRKSVYDDLIAIDRFCPVTTGVGKDKRFYYDITKGGV